MNSFTHCSARSGLKRFLLVCAALLAAPLAQAQSWTKEAGEFQGGAMRQIFIPLLGSTTATGDSWAAVYFGGMFKQASGSSTWVPMNNGLTDKRVYGFALNSGVSPYRGYAATRGGGVFKTIDGGTNWTAVNNGLGCVYVRSVQFVGVGTSNGIGSSASTDRLLASTECGANSGVYLSTDGGANWTATTGMAPDVLVQSVSRINPTSGVDFLLAATYDGVYKSTDNGLTWTLSNGAITSPNGANINNVTSLYSSTGGLAIFAAEANTGVWKSTDNGASWGTAPVFSEIPTAGVGTDGNANGNLYYPVDGKGVFISADRGTSWTMFATGAALPGGRAISRNTTVTGSPIFYAQTFAGIYQSTNGGATWTKTSSGLPGGYTINAASDSSNQFYLAAAEGVFKDPPNTGPMQRLGGYNLGIFFGGGHVLVTPANVPYAITSHLGVFKYDGTNWVAKNAGLPNMIRQGSQLRSDPNNANGLYLGLNLGGIYYSADGGETWSARSTGLSGKALQIRHMAVTPAYALIATNDGLYKSTNGGTNWTRLAFAAKSPANVELPINHVRVDSGNANIYATVFQTSSAGVTYPGSGVWKSTDLGNTWTQSLAGKQAHEVSVARTSSGATLYAGVWDAVGGGVMQSTDDAATWAPINAGLTDNYISNFGIIGGVMKGVLTRGEGVFSFNPPTTAVGVNYDQVFISRNKNLPGGGENFSVGVRFPRQPNDQLKSAVLTCPGALSSNPYTFNSSSSAGNEWGSGASFGSTPPATPFNCTSTVTFNDNSVNSKTVTIDRFSPADYYVTNVSLQPNQNVTSAPVVTWSAPTGTPPSSGFTYQGNVFSADFSSQLWFFNYTQTPQASYSGPPLMPNVGYQMGITTIEGTGTNVMHAAQTWIPFCYQCGSGTTNTTTGTTTTTTGTTTTTTVALNLVSGWNLMGNSSSGAIDVATVFGDRTKVTTVWKWVAATAKWAFYAPSLSDGGAAYAASKGYDFLTSISGGEGFWVNAGAVFTAPLPAGTAVTSASFQLMASGWNLISIGDGKTPSQFNSALSSTPPSPGVTPTNLTTLWAWDATQLNWYFYAPSLEANGGLAAYITSKSYLNFGTNSLGASTGFWVNKP